MMRTGHVTESLSAYLDGEVGGAERARIEAHLGTCADCRAHLESLRCSVALVQGLDPVSAPGGFQAAVHTRVTASAAAKQSPSLRWDALPRPRLSWKAAGAVAAILLIGLFSGNLLRGMRPAQVGLQRDQAAVERAAPETAPGTAVLPAPSAAIPQLRRVIRTAQVTLAVDDLDAAVRRLVAVTESAGGFVANSSIAPRGATPEGVFTLRVPAPRFGAVLEQVEDLGAVETRRISGTDVTEEFVDLGARVRNLERHEQRLLSFIDRATKVSDLLAIEQELARVRGEIEQLTGRLRYLANQVDLATIEVALRQKAAKTGGFWDFRGTAARIRGAFLATVRQILAAAEWLAVAIGALAPVAVLLGFAWLLIRRLRARPV